MALTTCQFRQESRLAQPQRLKDAGFSQFVPDSRFLYCWATPVQGSPSSLTLFAPAENCPAQVYLRLMLSGLCDKFTILISSLRWTVLALFPENYAAKSAKKPRSFAALCLQSLRTPAPAEMPWSSIFPLICKRFMRQIVESYIFTKKLCKVSFWKL